MNSAVMGYAEGYYGRLLSWQERHEILDVLHGLGQNTYYYAPKEDAYHRLHWRNPYDEKWRDDFRQFCHAARERKISVVAGIAPGLDFDFRHLEEGKDWTLLLSKAQQLLIDGATAISVLLDDIDPSRGYRHAGFAEEGTAHAVLINRLGENIGQSVWVTPRIYANELAAGEPQYLHSFFAALLPHHSVLYCGSDIVARRADMADMELVAGQVPHRLIFWDNLYANDYCPRRLFVGPWQGREAIREVLLNPTGMVHTDALLLQLVSATTGSGKDVDSTEAAWRNTLQDHGVIEDFFTIAPYFCHPVFNNQAIANLDVNHEAAMTALEACLWRWKTPLAREWYPFLFGLKHDLLIATDRLPYHRVRKTQMQPLASYLTEAL